MLRTAAAVLAAAAVLWAAAGAHLHHACTVNDTPYLPLCDAPVPAGPEAAQRMRERIVRNPGDAGAWAGLLVLQGTPEHDPVLASAALVAPHHSNVLHRRAASALHRGELEKGVALLVQLVQHRSSGQAAQLLAQVVASGEGLRLLRPHLATAGEWLPQVLGSLSGQNLPVAAGLPVVAEAMQRGGTLPEQARRNYMRALKSAGLWLDAYGLWLAHHKQLVPLLYNGGFEEAFEPDGFDWEIQPVVRSRAGVLVYQTAVARRGLVLDLEFTGRRFAAPIVRQHVFVPPGTYRLRGEYMASKFRSESGLAWSLRCLGNPKTPLARLMPLHDTGGVWKPLELVFSVPDDCGPMATLRLEPAADFEAAAGMKGRVAFDNFSLVRAAAQ